MSNVSQKDYESLAEFRYALRKFLRFSEQAARAAGLSPQQHQALLAIRGFPSGEKVTVGALAERLCSKPQSTSELLSRLQRSGYVERDSSDADGRQVHVTLTEAGEAVLQRLASTHQQELRRLGPELKSLLEQAPAEPRAAVL
jgi:DNA-binding MarR family transcriptional regulator